ncbi:MAG: heme biosynthesis HemY N-terminal domain-containing protein [Methylocella sp.]
MIRVLLFFAVLIALAFAEAWLVDRPGDIVLNWQGYRIETSVVVGIGAVIVAAAALVALWTLVRFVFKIPSLMSLATRSRHQQKGYAALSRGMIAVGAGDAQAARKSAAEAQRLLRNEPLALLLKAQAAQLSGEPHQAEAAFKEMTERNDMRLLGLRGLHVEAQRRGDAEQANHYASAAREIALLPWAAQASFEHKVAGGDWQGALTMLETSAAAKVVDKEARERQRAVLETAIALEKIETAPNESLRLARLAIKREPSLVPAIALAARLLTQNGEVRKATKLIESSWAIATHPGLAKLYLDLHPGESNAGRLSRALTLARLAPREPESKITVAEAAIAAGDFKAAREAMQPLIEGPQRPTSRMCLIMAELEEAEHGSAGYIREWLTRGSTAPRDPTWVADGMISDQWLPTSPVTGKLDAFAWRSPVKDLGPDPEADKAIVAQIAGPRPTLLIEETRRKALSPPKSESGPAAEDSETSEPKQISGLEPTIAATLQSPTPVADQTGVVEEMPQPPESEPHNEGGHEGEKPKPRGLAQLFDVRPR